MIIQETSKINISFLMPSSRRESFNGNDYND